MYTKLSFQGYHVTNVFLHNPWFVSGTRQVTCSIASSGTTNIILYYTKI